MERSPDDRNSDQRHFVVSRHEYTPGDVAALEAGLCGLGTALLYLAPGIVTRPMEAPPYVIVYGGAALILGLLVGLFLRAAAVLVLR